MISKDKLGSMMQWDHLRVGFSLTKFEKNTFEYTHTRTCSYIQNMYTNLCVGCCVASPQPPLLRAEQTRGPQPLLYFFPFRLSFVALLCGPFLDTYEYIYSCKCYIYVSHIEILSDFGHSFLFRRAYAVGDFTLCFPHSSFSPPKPLK